MDKKEELKKLVDIFELEAKKLGYHILVFAQSEKNILVFRTQNCPDGSILPLMERSVGNIFEKNQ